MVAVLKIALPIDFKKACILIIFFAATRPGASNCADVVTSNVTRVESIKQEVANDSFNLPNSKQSVPVELSTKSSSQTVNTSDEHLDASSTLNQHSGDAVTQRDSKDEAVTPPALNLLTLQDLFMKSLLPEVKYSVHGDMLNKSLNVQPNPAESSKETTENPTSSAHTSTETNTFSQWDDKKSIDRNKKELDPELDKQYLSKKDDITPTEDKVLPDAETLKDSTTTENDNLSKRQDEQLLSISSVDQIVPSSRGPTSEDTMDIDLELSDYVDHDTNSHFSEFGYHTKYSFSKFTSYQWSTTSSQRHSVPDDTQKTLDVSADIAHDIQPTRVETSSIDLTNDSGNFHDVINSVVSNDNQIFNSDNNTLLGESYLLSSMETASVLTEATSAIANTNIFLAETDTDKLTSPTVMNSSNYLYHLLNSIKSASESDFASPSIFASEPVNFKEERSQNHHSSSNEENPEIITKSETEFTSSQMQETLPLLTATTLASETSLPVSSEIQSDLASSHLELNSKTHVPETTIFIETSIILEPDLLTTFNTQFMSSTIAKQANASNATHQLPPRSRFSIQITQTTKDIAATTPTLGQPTHSSTEEPKIGQPCAFVQFLRSPPAGPQSDEDTKEMTLPTYVHVHLAQDWPDFCRKRMKLKNRFSHVFGLGDQNTVKPDQFIFAGVKTCNNTRRQHARYGIHVYVYTLDSNGNYSEPLTTELENRLKKRPTSSPNNEDEVDNEICDVEIYKSGIETRTVANELSGGMSNSGMIAAVTVSVVAGIALMLMFTMLLILKQRQGKEHDSTASSDSYSMNSFSARGSNRRKKPSRLSIRSFLNQAFDEPEIPNHPLNYNNLNSALQNRTALEEEFKSIPTDVPKLESLPQGAEPKNRFANVIPVPETRVPLNINSDQPGYINANFVRGYGGKAMTYIATQAPLTETMEDFWRMVWEQQTRAIVMLTEIERNGVNQCAQYFPENTVDCNKLYGDFQVTLLEKDVRENFVKSTLRLHDLDKNLFRDITHLWYTAWPHNGVPEDPSAFMAYILDTRLFIPKNSGPVVVHCSSGTGRTGTFIATDICMHEYQESRCVDILRCVARLRQDRSGSVQTGDQYIFIHEALHSYAIKLGTQSHRPSLMSLVSLKLSHQDR